MVGRDSDGLRSIVCFRTIRRNYARINSLE
jgi:hypothetical protein